MSESSCSALPGAVPKPPDDRWLRGVFLAVAGITATGAPWLLGGETVRTEWWLLGGAVATLGIGLLVRWKIASTAPARASWRAMRWAVVSGLLLLGLIGVQAVNPAQRVVLENRLWRLEAVQSIPGIPQALAAPFEAIAGDGLPYRNAPRYLLIFGIGWAFATGLALGLTRARDARRFARLLGLNAAVLAVVCIVHVASGAQLTLWRYHGGFDFSHSPVFFYKNHNGAYLAGSLAVVLGLAAGAVSRKERKAAEVVGFAVWAATVMVDSRVATVAATALGLSYLAWIARRKIETSTRGRRVAGIATVLLGAAALLFVLRDSSAVKRFAPMFSEPADFVQGGEFRSHLREVGLEMWADRPVWGWGGGAFLYLFNTYHTRVPELAEMIYRQQPTLNRFYWPTANCDWIEFAVEYGAVGLLLLAGMGLIPVARCWRWRGRLGVFELFFLGGAGVLMAHGFFDYVLRNPAVMLLFASLQIVVVASLAAGDEARAKADRPAS